MAVLLLAAFGCAAYFRTDRLIGYALSEKREGDILFQSLPHGSLVDAIEGATGSPWSHCGILVREDGRWMVAEALGQVRYTPVYTWVGRGRKARVEAYRVTRGRPPSHEELIRGIDALLGTPYDFQYAPDDAHIYCSELVYKVFERGSHIRIGTWQKLGDLNWKPHESFIQEMEGELPLDREMITPVALTKSPNVTRVHPRW